MSGPALTHSRRGLGGGAELDGRAPLVAPVAVRVIDLDDPVQDITLRGARAGGRYRSLLAVARCEGRPLTTATFTVGSDGHVPSRRLVHGLHGRLPPDPLRFVPINPAPTTDRSPMVSVVIPTCANPGPLRRCVRSVLRSDYANFEVVVVENRPARASTEAMIEQHFGGDRRIRCVQEYRPGASHARNAGLACARGEVVAFTDDDVVVDRRWLRANIEALVGQDDVACVAGLILPLELESESQLLMEQFASFGKGFRPTTFRLPDSRAGNPLFPYTAGAIGSGASTMILAETARELGGFDPRLGPGTPASGGEDLELFIRLLRAGHAVAYEPGAIVWHRHPDGVPVLRRQVYRYGVGLGAMLAKQLIAGPDRGDFIRAVPAGIRYMRDPDSRKNAGKPANYPRALTWFERAGMVLGPFAYVLSIVQAVLRRLAGADVSTPFRTTRSIRQLRLAGGGVVPMARFSKHARSLRERGGEGVFVVLSREAALAVRVALALCVMAPLAASLDAPEPIRLPLVLGLFCVAPGLAVILAIRARPEPGLVLAVSVAVTSLLALAMVWLGAWWPIPMLWLLAAACAVPLRGGLRATGLPAARRRSWRRAIRRWTDVAVPTQCHAAILVLALLVWALALTSTRLGHIGGAGLLDALPAGYYLSVVLVLAGFTAAIRRRDTDPRVLGFYVLGLILILHGTTALLYDEPRYSWVYKHLGVINLIGATGHVDRSIDIYNNWPSFFAGNAWLSRTTGVAPAAYAPFAQLFFNVFDVLALRFALRGVTRNERVLWTASLLFVLGNWVGQDYLSPQAFGFALSLVVIGLCLRCARSTPVPRSRLAASLVDRIAAPVNRILPPPVQPEPSERPPMTSRAAVVIGGACALAVITAHQLSPVFLILDLIAIAVLTRRLPLWVPAALGLIELGWLALAWPFVSRHFTLIQVGSGQGAAAPGRDLAAAPAGARLSFYAPALVMLLMAALGGYGFVRRLRAGRRDLALAGLIVAPGLAVAVQSYGGEGPYRAFLFALPWLAFLAAMACVRGSPSAPRAGIAGRRLAVVTPILAAALLFASFGQELANHILRGDVQASTWYERHAPAGSLRINLAPDAPDRLTQRYPLVSLSDPPSLVERRDFTAHRLGRADVPRLQRIIAQQGAHPVYVVLTRGQENYARLNGLLPPGALNSFVAALRASPAFQPVFSRPGAWIFRYRRVASGTGVR